MGELGKQLPTLPFRHLAPTVCSLRQQLLPDTLKLFPTMARTAGSPRVFLFSPLLGELSLFDLDNLQMGERLCYQFWNWAFKQCRSLSFLNWFGIFFQFALDKDFACSSTTFHSSILASMFWCTVVCHVCYGCSCVPIYFDGPKQIQRKSEALECTGV